MNESDVVKEIYTDIWKHIPRNLNEPEGLE